MAKDDFENGVWRTVGGRRIFIRDGEDLSSAMKRSGKFKGKNIEKEKQKAFDNKDEQFQRRMEEYYDRSQKQGGYNPDVKEKIREAYGKTEEEMNQKIKEIGDNRVADETSIKNSEGKVAQREKENNSSNKYKDLYDKEDYDKIISHLSEEEKRELQDTKDSLMYYPKGSEKYNKTYQKGLDLERKAAERYMEKESSKEKSSDELKRQYEIEGMGRISESQMRAEYDHLKKEGNIGSESYNEWRDDIVRDPRSAVEEVSSKKQQGVQKLKDKLSGNKEQDEVATVKSQMSELEKASGSKVKDAFQTDLFGNGKENRFILEDGTVVGHTLETFGQKRDYWYIGDKSFKSYDDVKKYLSGGSKKGGDEFEDLSKELKEISSRTGKSDLSSEAGQRWNELYKKDKNNVSRDLGDGYRMGVGYDGTVDMHSSHPYDETDYSWAHKKDNGEWVVHNPIKGEYTTKTFSSREEALKEMKDIDKRLMSGNRTMSYEGITKHDSPKGIRRSDGGYAKDSSIRKNEMLNDLKFYEKMDKNYQKNEDWLATKADYESQFGKYEPSSGSNKAYKNAFEEYKKKHPNTKLTLQKFIDMSEGK